MEFYDQSDIGKWRQVNQDMTHTELNDENQLLAIVCDGMGGHLSGELAARMVCETISESFKKHGAFNTPLEGRAWMKSALIEANHKVHMASEKSSEHHGMGTTVVLALVLKDVILLSHVGDSRAYFIDRETMIQLTIDHTYVNLLVESGSITKEQAKHHPKKNILMQAVGVYPDLNITIDPIEKKAGCLLLCSDGLYNFLDENDIFNIVCKEETDVKTKTQQLIENANEYGGYDNIGIALIKFEGGNDNAVE